MMRNIIDKKYHDLAEVLRTLLPGPVTRPLPQAPVVSARHPQMGEIHPQIPQPQAPIVSRPQLPVRVNSGFGIATTLLQNWLSSKKGPLIRFGITGGTLAFFIWLYNRFYNKKPGLLVKKESSETNDKRKNPDKFREKELSDFEKTFRALDRIRHFSAMSKHTSEMSGADYSSLLKNESAFKEKETTEDPQKLEAKKRHSRLETAGNQLLKDIDNISKVLKEVPKTNKESFKFLTTKKEEETTLPSPKEILRGSSTFNNDKSKKEEPRAKDPISTSPITVKPKKRKKKAKIAKVESHDEENSEKSNEKNKSSSKIKAEVSNELFKTLTPIIKFTKKIRKI
jgi:hypothetical protein